MWAAVSIAPETKVMSYLLAIACNGWCEHVLNAFYLKCSFIHFSSWCLLVSIGRNAMVSGFNGTCSTRTSAWSPFT